VARPEDAAIVIRSLRQSRKALVGFALLVVFVGIALLGPLLAPDPSAPVGVPLEPPSAEHWFGTTGQGQDVFAQTVAGTRTSLFLGLGVGLVVVAVGALVGTTAGYFGGLVDDLLSLLINVFLIMPGLPLMVVIAAYLPSGAWTTALVLVVTGWGWSARVFRAQAMALRHTDFIAAAVVGGESPLRIIAFEIVPNMASLLVSAFIGATVYAIGAHVGLEFLGLGDLGHVSWGTNLYWARNDAALLTGSWWTFVPTGACVGLVGLAMALLNNALDEVGDPRLRSDPRYRQAMGGRWTGATPVMARRPRA
jgi:peptide/nickel transport system permease protein